MATAISMANDTWTFRCRNCSTVLGIFTRDRLFIGAREHNDEAFKRPAIAERTDIYCECGCRNRWRPAGQPRAADEQGA